MSIRTTLFAAIAMSASTAVWAAEHTKDSLDQVKENLAGKKAVLLDVREQGEWDRGHLKDARLVPLSELKKADSDAGVKEKLAEKLPKDRIIYCHCARGVRALFAAQALEKLGYDVRPLEAGYDELCENGFEAAAAESAK
jgi:rhodanese-related sulfurtransferase